MSFWIVKDLEFTYRGRQINQPVLKGVSFSIEAGETVALMGPNGSGKTTLGKLLMGILEPDCGQVLLEGRDIKNYSLGEIGARIGYIFQNPEKQIFTSSVREEINFGLQYRSFTAEETNRRVNEMLNCFELTHRAEAFPFNLSRGEKQRLALAAVLALEPGFIIFDEPTTGLDMRRKDNFAVLLEKVKAKGTGYILISHDHEFSSICCDREIILKEGNLVCAGCN
ncbi:MAG: ABC transporter ATP-binding protein [Bacillota bacterium]|nr:ABC transporter ATP-binding protein [Bacillota bacterium]